MPNQPIAAIMLHSKAVGRIVHEDEYSDGIPDSEFSEDEANTPVSLPLRKYGVNPDVEDTYLQFCNQQLHDKVAAFAERAAGIRRALTEPVAALSESVAALSESVAAHG